MRNHLVLLLITVLIATAASGCGSTSDPISTDTSTPVTRISDNTEYSGRYLLGIWDVQVSEDRETVVVIPDRETSSHYNVLWLIENWQCSNCFKIEFEEFSEPNYWKTDIQILHPMSGTPYPDNLRYTGFDVRAVLMTDSNYEFHGSGVSMSVGNEHVRMIDNDGYTTLWNPTDYPEGSGPVMRTYVGGKLSNDEFPDSTLNQFVTFTNETNRNVFFPGQNHHAYSTLALPEGPIRFGYAIDASWHPPTIDPPIDYMQDFPESANSSEAYKILTEYERDLLPETGSSTRVRVTVHDHQGYETISSVTVECPDLFAGQVPMEYVGPAPTNKYIYMGEIVNETGAGYGDYPILVKVTDTDLSQDTPAVSWDVETIRITEGYSAVLWGPSTINDICVDASGNCLAGGTFIDQVDFDPGFDELIYEEVTDGIFLIKYDDRGRFRWAKAWQCDGIHWSRDIQTDSAGNIVFLFDSDGSSIDLDPGPGVDTPGEAGDEICLVKLDPDGNYIWGHRMGSVEPDYPTNLAIDSMDNIHISGCLAGETDFDPGPGSEIHDNSAGGSDGYVCKYDSDGNFVWFRQFEGGWNTVAVIEFDDFDNLLVGGEFLNTVDFDPGPDEYLLSSLPTYSDAYLLKLTTGGELVWVDHFQGTDTIWTIDLDTDGSGNVYVTGEFWADIDVNPDDPGTMYQTTNGEKDIFITKVDTDGTPEWSRSLGNDEIDAPRGIGTDQDGNCIITGQTSADIDLDPGPGVDFHFEQDGGFVVRLDPDGNYTWGYTLRAAVHGSDSDDFGNVYYGGANYRTIDYDPGPGIEYYMEFGDPGAFTCKVLPGMSF